jgi:hypothetical protein
MHQIIAKNLRDGKELKMDIMVMENLFFKRKVSRIYDLKGSLRSRYNPDTSGNNKVLLDLNLLETLHTKPIFLGSKAKRRLERAVWNDTSFLAVSKLTFFCCEIVYEGYKYHGVMLSRLKSHMFPLVYNEYYYFYMLHNMERAVAVSIGCHVAQFSVVVVHIATTES